MPSQGFQTRKNAIQSYDTKIEEVKKNIAETNTKVTNESAARESNDGNRENMIKELAELDKKKIDLETKLK